jgi:hypothetical protein
MIGFWRLRSPPRGSARSRSRRLSRTISPSG